MLHIPKALYKDISILQKKQNKTKQNRHFAKCKLLKTKHRRI